MKRQQIWFWILAPVQNLGFFFLCSWKETWRKSRNSRLQKSGQQNKRINEKSNDNWTIKKQPKAFLQILYIFCTVSMYSIIFFSFRDVDKTKYLIFLNLRVLNHQSVDLILQDTLVLSINFVAFHFKAVIARKARI